MNVLQWMQEVRRLIRALHPGATDDTYHSGTIALEHHPEQMVTDRGRKDPRVPEHWTAQCGSGSCDGATPEEAAAKLVAKLEEQIDKKIAAARAEVTRLEAAQAAKLRIVRTEKPS